MVPKTIKIYGEDCYYVPHKVMKKLYDAEEHKHTYVMYNGNYYVKPSKLSTKAKEILKTNDVHFL